MHGSKPVILWSVPANEGKSTSVPSIARPGDDRDLAGKIERLNHYPPPASIPAYVRTAVPPMPGRKLTGVRLLSVAAGDLALRNPITGIGRCA
jgi:hypothetical protein